MTPKLYLCYSEYQSPCSRSLKGVSKMLTRSKWLTIVTMITLSRAIIGTIGIIYLALHENFAAVLILIVAFATDAADGYFARKYEVTTKTGAMLDRLVDKYLIIGITVCLVFLGTVPQFPAVVFIVGEIILTAMAISAKNDEEKECAGWPGKIKLWFELLTLFLYLLCSTTVGSLTLIVMANFMFVMTVPWLIASIADHGNRLK